MPSGRAPLISPIAVQKECGSSLLSGLSCPHLPFQRSGYGRSDVNRRENCLFYRFGSRVVRFLSTMGLQGMTRLFCLVVSFFFFCSRSCGRAYEPELSFIGLTDGGPSYLRPRVPIVAPLCWEPNLPRVYLPELSMSHVCSMHRLIHPVTVPVIL